MKSLFCLAVFAAIVAGGLALADEPTAPGNQGSPSSLPSEPQSLPLPRLEENAAGGIGPAIPVPGTNGNATIIPGITPGGDFSIGGQIIIPF